MEKRAIRRMFGRWRLRLWVALAVALGLGVGFVPLFGVLGFELATVAALFAAVMGLDVGAAFARELQHEPQIGVTRATYAGRTMARASLAAGGLAAAVAAIPALIAVVRGLWVPTCDWWFGISSYLAMPIATAVLAGALGHAIGVLAGPRTLRGSLIAQVPTLLVVVTALYRFYSEPPVFSYNPILGFFPGNLYDENVELGWPLFWERVENLAVVVAVIAFVAWRLDVPSHRFHRIARPAGRRLAAPVLALVAAALAVVVHLDGGSLGYAIDADDLQDVLDGRYETEHFIIHYAHTKDIDADIALIAADHEFRYAEVVAQLGMAPEGKLRSYYFATKEQKGKWFGARDVEMAKPWRHEIYLDHRPFPHGALRHEIAHAIASSFGDPLFGVATRYGVLANPGLIEGLAVAIDWPGGYEGPTPHESVKALQELGLQPSLSQLLSLQFFSVSSARGYTTAGSFLRYLLDTYGAARLRALYHNGGDFEAAYDVPLSSLEGGWRQMLSEIKLPAGQVDALKERFRGGSVFARPCPHAIAKRTQEATAAYGRGENEEAIALMRAVCRDAPEEPRYRFDLANFLASGQMFEHAEAKRIWAALGGDVDRVTVSLRVAALRALSHAYAFEGDRDRAVATLHEAGKLPVDFAERRVLDGELIAVDHAGPAAPWLYKYFFTGGASERIANARAATEAEPDFAFAHYLYGIQLTNEGTFDESAKQLARALDLGLPDIRFVENAARLLAIAAFRADDHGGLDRALAALTGPGTTEGDHLLAKDWEERRKFTFR